MSHSAPEGSEAEAACKPPLAVGLYIVALPIGNAEDITLRALRILGQVDLIACEDTRTTGGLMARYGIATRRLAYHEHNADKVRPRLIEHLKKGGGVALVSDAGTPLVSDPGFKLVRACLEEGIAVTALPGASAVLDALVLSGLPSARFLFAGFPPPRAAARRAWLGGLRDVPATLVMMESPKRLSESLADMAAVLGDRPAAVARELTKLFEEVRRQPLEDLAAHYAAAGPPKGEVMVVVGPPGEEEAPSADDLDAALRAALEGASLKQAVAEVAARLRLPRKEVYARALALAGREDR